MEGLLKKLIKYDLSPNQFFTLYFMKKGKKSTVVNIDFELRYLKSTGWVNLDGKVSQKGIDVVSGVEEWFSSTIEKTNKSKLGDNYKEKIEAYRELFPKGLHNGRTLRSSYNNLKTTFDKFFKEYDYPWDIILRATKCYLDLQEDNNFKFCKNSRYFIMKSINQTNDSELGNYCELIISGELEENKNDTFRGDKVF